MKKKRIYLQEKKTRLILYTPLTMNNRFDKHESPFEKKKRTNIYLKSEKNDDKFLMFNEFYLFLFSSRDRK